MSQEQLPQPSPALNSPETIDDAGIGLDMKDPHETIEGMDEETQKEETAWEQYRPIGSPEYNLANQERIEAGKIKVIKVGKAERTITLMASIKIDPDTGHVISGHEYRPDAESMADTEKAFADYLAITPTEQRAVIYEGDERRFTERNEAIREGADSGLVQYLAAKENVPAVSGELSNTETVVAMEQMGVTKDELLALYVARGLEGQLTSGEDFLAGYINYQAVLLGIEGFHDYTEAEKQAINAEGRLDEIKADLTKKVETLLCD